MEKWKYKNELLEDVKASDLLLIAGSDGQPQFLPVARAHSPTPEEAGQDIQQTAEEMDLQARRDGRAMASCLFAAFITSSHYSQLYQCARCQKFFVNVRRRRNTKYCSVRCAHSDTAVKATREKYQKKRQEKVNRINAAIADLATREDRSTLLPNWKQWVADHASVHRKTHVFDGYLIGSIYLRRLSIRSFYTLRQRGSYLQRRSSRPNQPRAAFLAFRRPRVIVSHRGQR